MVSTVTSTTEATAVTYPPKPVRGGGGGTNSPPPPRRGGGGDFSRRGKDPGEVPERFRVGAWATLVVVVVTFTVLTGVYILRAVGADKWETFRVPFASWIGTAALLCSSLTVELVRRSLKRHELAAYRRWTLATLGFGLAFLGSQFAAWRELAAQGLYLATNPHSSFFYLLTATHALHLLVGLVALAYLFAKREPQQEDRTSARNRAAMTDAVAIYWHLMGVLWGYLFVLLFWWK
jgi:cytochrome c oxidase subunit 3